MSSKPLTISEQVLRAARKYIDQPGQSVNSLARLSSVPQSTLHGWIFSTTSGVSAKTVDKVAAALGVRVK